jgi:hypothetical protein
MNRTPLVVLLVLSLTAGCASTASERMPANTPPPNVSIPGVSPKEVVAALIARFNRYGWTVREANDYLVVAEQAGDALRDYATNRATSGRVTYTVAPTDSGVHVTGRIEVQGQNAFGGTRAADVTRVASNWRTIQAALDTVAAGFAR